MADTYVPGMEFRSWRSMPRLRDQIGSPVGMLIGGAIDALTGSNAGTDMMSKKKVENAMDPAEFAGGLNVMKEPVAPPSYAGQGKFPSAYQTQEDLTQAPLTIRNGTGVANQPLLPALPSLTGNTQTQPGGYRKFLDMTPAQ
jgi:hypothetical protein